jgi:hypothetical protein
MAHYSHDFLAPPKNVTNLFCNWLKGIPKKEVMQIRVGICAQCGISEMILFLTNKKH